MDDLYVERLFDALTDYECTSRRDIATVTGWTPARVDNVLHYVRRPDVAADWGWTVPHVPRGTGRHLFQVVEVNGNAALDADESEHLRAGAISTLRLMASSGENEGNALRFAARHLSPAKARLVLQTVTASEGAAAMARHAAEALAAP